MAFTVFVDENSHFMDPDERYRDGDYPTYETAVAECRRMVDDDLREQLQPNVSADALLAAWQMWGRDPWIAGGPTEDDRFNAWDFARERAPVIAAEAAPAATGCGPSQQ